MIAGCTRNPSVGIVHSTYGSATMPQTTTEEP
jgi:hypothetical protein